MKKLSNKQKVYKLFRKGRVWYFSDISDKLNLDLEEVVNICQELLDEGKLSVHFGEKV